MKKLCLSGMVVLSICLSTACAKPSAGPATTAATTAAATTAAATTAAATTAATTVAATTTAAADVETSQEEVGNGMVNPMTEYEDVVSLQDALGFEMLVLPKVYAIQNDLYFTYTLSATEILGEIQAETAEGVPFSIRKQEGNEDITGYAGMKFEDKKLGEVAVHVGKDGESSAAWWSDAKYSYAFTTAGMDEATFDSYLEELVGMSKN